MLLLVLRLHRLVLMTTVADPARPLLAPWYRLVEDGDRLLLEHGQEVVVLEGAAVRALLPLLLPLLDGTRTVDDLAAELGEAARPAVEHALTVLGSHGVLTAGPPPPEGDAARVASLALAAAHRLPPALVLERARSARLAIVGGAPIGTDIAWIVRRAGLSLVSRGSWEGADAELVLVAPTAEELPRLESWNAATLRAGVTWLPVVPFDGRFVGVGPLVVPSESACWSCVSLRRGSNLDYRSDLQRIEAVPTRASVDPGVHAVAAGVAASLALRWLLAHDTTLPGELFAVESSPLPAIEAHPVLRVPRCATCSRVEQAAPRLPWHEARAA